MKPIILIVLLLSAGVLLGATDFTVRGTRYESPYAFYSFEKVRQAEIDKGVSWRIGRDEPPVAMNDAISKSKKALEQQFGTEIRADLRAVTLRIVVSMVHNGPLDHYHWEVLFVEAPTAEEISRRQTPDGRVEVANITYLVLMNGEVVSPRKKPNKAPEPTPTAAP